MPFVALSVVTSPYLFQKQPITNTGILFKHDGTAVGEVHQADRISAIDYI